MFIYIYICLYSDDRKDLNHIEFTQTNASARGFQLPNGVSQSWMCFFFRKFMHKKLGKKSVRNFLGNILGIPMTETLPRFKKGSGRKEGCQVLSLTCNRQTKFARSSTFGESTVEDRA